MRVLFVAQQIDYEPQGIMHLSSVLKAAGHEVDLSVAAHEDPVEVARRFRPGIVGYSVLTGSQHYYLEINRRIKAQLPEVFAVFGGPHPTFFPEMIENDGVDGVCVGEGEHALLDLANALHINDDSPPTLDSAIPNWHFKLAREDGRYAVVTPTTDGSKVETIRNPVRPYIADLDALPLPDRDLIYSHDPVAGRSKIKHFISQRGCPYNCTYCFNHALSAIYEGKGPRFRQRSVSSLLEEVRQVKDRYPLEFVVFVDDTFFLSKKWLAKFAKRYPQEIGLPFFCNTRANLVTEEQVRLLKRAGCHTVSMGIETGNDRLRNDLLKRNMTRQQITEAAWLFHQGGLHFTTTNMIGLPTSTLEDDFETLQLNVECRPDYAHVFIFQPYPKTELGEFTREHGWMVGTFDDIGQVAWDTSVLNFGDEHQRQLVTLQRLFALVVEWPWLLPLARRLIKLPNNPLFWLANKLWKGYAIKKRVHPVRLSLREYVDTVRHFMKIHS